MFGGRAKLVFSSLSLLLSGTLLLLSLNFAFYDANASAREAAATSAPLFFLTSYNDFGTTNVYSGRAYSARLASLGIPPTYEVTQGLSFSDRNLNNPGNASLFLADSINIGSVSYAPSDGQAVVSDYLCQALGIGAGADLGSYYTEFKGLGITVGQEAATGYGAARSRFPDSPSGDQSYSELLSTSYLFVAINPNTYITLLEKEGLTMWNLALGESSGRTTGCQLYTKAYGNPALLYGRYPSSADEVILSENLGKDVGDGDESAAVGKEIPVYASTHDYYGMSKHFASLKVCGVFQYNADGFFASEAFFEELKGEAKYEATIIFGTDALLAYVDAGRPKDIIVASAPVADPLKSADEIAADMAGLRTAFLIVGGILGALSLTLLSLYSLDAMRRGEKDIAILKSLGKGSLDIASVFLFMDVIIVTGALILSLIAGFFVTRWVGGIVQSTMFLSFDPVPNSPWSFLIVAAAAYALPVAASLFAGRAVYRTDVAAVFKRNLS